MSVFAKGPVPWPVPWAKGQTVYLRAGDVIERAMMEAELAGEHRAGRVYPFEMEAAFGEGLATLLAETPDDAGQLLQFLQTESEGAELGAADKAMLAQARDLLAEHWPPYRALRAKQERRNAMIPLVALRRYCTGWEGKGLPAFARGPDGLVTLEAAAGLEMLTITAAGSFAYSLQYGGGAVQGKNSEPPSKSGGDQGTSTSSTPRKAGTSTARAGSKTRSSRSTRKRSPSSTSGSTAKG